MATQNSEKETKNGVYLFYGEETYLKENALKKVKKAFKELILGINYIVLDESNIKELIQNIETPAFGYESKLIIVKDSGLFKKETKGKKTKNEYSEVIANYIAKNIKIINQTVLLVFLENEICKNELAKIIEQEGSIYNFERIKPQEIKNKISAICKAYNVKIDNDTLQYFIETCGTDMQKLINEIRKLIEYVGTEGIITKESINALSTKELESVIFDLTDNLGKKNIKQALIVLEELLYNKEPIQKILITLYNHFRKIYLLKLSQKYKKDATIYLNLKQNQTFLISKYKKQSEYFTEKELRNILQELINLDYNYKQGNIDINIGLESILCTYF